MNEAETFRETFLTGQYIVKILSAVLHNTAIPVIPDSITWNQVYDMAKNHCVESMVYRGAKTQIEKNPQLWAEWKLQTDQNLVQGVVQLAERDAVIAGLTNAEIQILPLKGCWLKELYPQIDYRQMGDLDILIEPEKADRAKAVMESLGYEVCTFEEQHHDQYKKPPYTAVELHREMVPSWSSLFSYYQDILKKALPVSETEYCYRLSPEDTYIYHLSHFAKHYRNLGSGIRSVMDIYIYLEKYENTWNRDYISGELAKLGLTDFAGQMEELCRYWFSTSDCSGTIPDEELKRLELNIFISGVYGSRIYEMARRMEECSRKGRKEKMKYIWSRIFMERWEAQYSYPVLRKYPVFLPLCWIHRVFVILFFKRSEVKKELELFGQKRD